MGVLKSINDLIYANSIGNMKKTAKSDNQAPHLVRTLQMFNLVKRVLSTHASPDEGKMRIIDVKLVAIKLREMRVKINCTIQGNYFSKIDQSLAIKFLSTQDTE